MSVPEPASASPRTGAGPTEQPQSCTVPGCMMTFQNRPAHMFAIHPHLLYYCKGSVGDRSLRTCTHKGYMYPGMLKRHIDEHHPDRSHDEMMVRPGGLLPPPRSVLRPQDQAAAAPPQSTSGATTGFSSTNPLHRLAARTGKVARKAPLPKLSPFEAIAYKSSSISSEERCIQWVSQQAKQAEDKPSVWRSSSLRGPSSSSRVSALPTAVITPNDPAMFGNGLAGVNVPQLVTRFKKFGMQDLSSVLASTPVTSGGVPATGAQFPTSWTPNSRRFAPY